MLLYARVTTWMETELWTSCWSWEARMLDVSINYRRLWGLIYQSLGIESLYLVRIAGFMGVPKRISFDKDWKSKVTSGIYYTFSVVSFHSREMVSYKLLRFKYKNLFHTWENKKPTVIHKFEIDRESFMPASWEIQLEHMLLQRRKLTTYFISITCKWDLEEGLWTRLWAAGGSQAWGAWCRRAAWRWPRAAHWPWPRHSWCHQHQRPPLLSPDTRISVSVTLSTSV